MSEAFSYDSVPYPSLTFPKTSPERLATQAAVNGLKATDPRNSRFLELGCGDGTNLLAHAFLYPNSQFIGIDLSQTHIDSANAAVAELGIKNADFRQMDVMDLKSGDLDQFDYVVAHGLFSWVPDLVRQKVLDIYSEYLAPNGVGYISYNTYPGCYIRTMVGEIMQFHTRKISEPIEKVNKGVAMLKFVGDVTDRDSTYQLMVREELEGMTERTLENIYHDDLSEVNQPFYFYEFAEMLAKKGMQYLSEAEEGVSNTGALSAEAINHLNSVSSNLVEREQYLDFIRCRRFRSTLFCRENIKLDRNYLQDHIDEFYFAGRLKTENTPSTTISDEAETFFGPTSEKIKCNHPLTKAAIRYLSDQWTWSVRFDELIKRSVETFKIPAESVSDDDVARTRDFMIELFRVGMFRLHCIPHQGVSEVRQKPRVSRFTRWQIERGSQTIMTLTGLSLEPDADITRMILVLADGTRTLNDIVDSLMEKLESQDGDQIQKRTAVEDAVKLNLDTLARNGVLEA